MADVDSKEVGGISLDAERTRVCLEAAWEIEAMVRLLPGLVPVGAD